MSFVKVLKRFQQSRLCACVCECACTRARTTDYNMFKNVYSVLYVEHHTRKSVGAKTFRSTNFPRGLFVTMFMFVNVVEVAKQSLESFALFFIKHCT